MRRTRRAGTGAVAITALALPLLLGACSSGGGDAAEPSSVSSAPSTSSTIAVNAGAIVDITASGAKAFSFTPEPVRVKVGQTVTWKNDSGTPHTIQSDPGQLATFDSDVMAADATFVTILATPGTYTYFCAIHSREVMSGTIVVEAA